MVREWAKMTEAERAEADARLERALDAEKEAIRRADAAYRAEMDQTVRAALEAWEAFQAAYSAIWNTVRGDDDDIDFEEWDDYTTPEERGDFPDNEPARLAGALDCEPPEPGLHFARCARLIAACGDIARTLAEFTRAREAFQVERDRARRRREAAIEPFRVEAIGVQGGESD